MEFVFQGKKPPGKSWRGGWWGRAGSGGGDRASWNDKVKCVQGEVAFGVPEWVYPRPEMHLEKRGHREHLGMSRRKRYFVS